MTTPEKKHQILELLMDSIRVKVHALVNDLESDEGGPLELVHTVVVDLVEAAESSLDEEGEEHTIPLTEWVLPKSESGHDTVVMPVIVESTWSPPEGHRTDSHFSEQAMENLRDGIIQMYQQALSEANSKIFIHQAIFQGNFKLLGPAQGHDGNGGCKVYFLKDRSIKS